MNANIFKSIISLCIFASATIAIASEFPVDRKQKESKSDLVVIGIISSVSRGEISADPFFTKYNSQKIEINFHILKFIKGSSKQDIVISCRSLRYNDGDTTRSCTAGFNFFDSQIGKKHIAYLTCTDGQYNLSDHSNQYLIESVDNANQ